MRTLLIDKTNKSIDFTIRPDLWTGERKEVTLYGLWIGPRKANSIHLLRVDEAVSGEDVARITLEAENFPAIILAEENND